MSKTAGTADAGRGGRVARAPYRFRSARDLFEAAREASADAGRIGRQLDAMERRALSLGGGGSPSGRVSGTRDPQRVASAVAALVDREAELRRRQEEDYALVDLACAVLYGRDSDAGLASLVPPWWCDVLWWRYLDGAPWARVAEAVGYSEHRCWEVAQAALEVADGWGLARAADGRGGAEG